MTEIDTPVATQGANRFWPPFVMLRDEPAATDPPDPAALVLTCANCGVLMDERKCKLVCSCGYFASCSDYY